ncbi:hypothetical protein K474DRAFT_1659198 [Panus rudis PR-1116 ss-1]|nr:hypothetical protein K474DRAFT_1659198 [Panus rudis PR-1116 ss-1]
MSDASDSASTPSRTTRNGTRDSPAASTTTKETTPAPSKPKTPRTVARSGSVSSKVATFEAATQAQAASSSSATARPASKGGRKKRSDSVSTVASSAAVPGAETSMKPPSSINVKKTSSKPASIRGAAARASHSRSASVVSDASTAITKSPSISRNARRTEEDRIQFFNEDPLCKEIEPHRAFCSKCDVWVELNPKRKYIMKNWIAHCKTLHKGDAQSVRSPSPGADEGEASDDDDAVSIAASTTTTRARRTTEAERKAQLEADPRAGEVRPQEVFCLGCKKWIRLGSKTNYALGNWNGHIARCTTPVTPAKPGNDARTSPAKEPAVSAEDDNLGEPSSLSDLPVPLPSPSALQMDTPAPASRKRRREEDEDEDLEVHDDATKERLASRSVKPRTEKYRPAQGLWRRLTEPFRAFIQGFREGLASADRESVPPS